MSTRLLVSHAADVLLLTLDSEDGFPRLERPVLAALGQQIAEFASSRKLAGAVITGTGRAFTAGAEIAELSRLTPVEAHEFARSGQRTFGRIAQSKKPVIAAIRGYCMGGGLDLALACHHRIAAPDAVFAHPGGAIGIMTGWGGTQRLPRLIGRARAMEMLTMGRQVKANEALNWGLILAIVPADKLIDEAVRLATIRSTL